MPEKFNQYSLTKTLSKKYSHVTYQASPLDEPERQLVVTVFSAFLFRFPHERQHLLQRAQQVKQLQHAHLVPIRDMGMEGEQPFVVREYLPNRSLRRCLKQLLPDCLPLRDALNIILQVGEALAYAHQQSIVHGNIKPENIFLDANGQAVLTDFHLVSRKDACIRDQTSEEYAFCYLAPEQFAGLTDAKSDQYALGCLTYELITGRVPFAAQSLASMMGQSSNALPAPLSESVADLPPSLDAAVLKTLAQDPSERFIDFSLFLEAIQSVLSLPPKFPLAYAIPSRKNRTISHPVRSTKVRDIAFPFPREAHLLTDGENEKKANDQLTHKSFLREDVELKRIVSRRGNIKEKDVFSITDDKSIEHNNSGYIEDEISIHDYDEYIGDDILSLSNRNNNIINVLQVRSGGRRVQGLVLLLSVVVAWMVYVFWSSISATHDTGLRTINKTQGVISQITRVSMEQVPLQVTNAIPTVQSSVTEGPIVQSSVTEGPIVQSVVPVPVIKIPPVGHPRSTPTPVPTPRSTPTPVPTPRSTPAPVPTPRSTPTPVPTPRSTPTPVPTPTPAPRPTPTDASITYEAESPQNTLAGGAQIISCPGCSGGYRVRRLGIGSNGQSGTLQFSINKADAGTYTLTLYYSNGSNRDEDEYISVNRGPAIIFTGSPTGSFDKFATVGIAVALNKGENTIEFYNPNGPAPSLDKIII